MANGKYYVDPVLTNISQKYTNDSISFLAEKIFPIVPVKKKTGIYFEYDRSNVRKPVDTTRTGRSKTPIAEYAVIQRNYGPLKEHDLKAPITKDEYDQYDSPLEPESDAVDFLNEQMLIEKEVNLVSVLSNTSVIPNATVATQWSAASGSTPFKDIETGVSYMKKNGFVGPNTMIMGYDVWSVLKNHADFLARVQYSTLGVMTEEMVKNLFSNSGITNILIGDAVYDAAQENQNGTTSNGYIWPKGFWLAYITPTPGLRRLNGGYTLTIPGDKYVDKWEDKDEKTTWVRNNDYYEQKLVGKEAFYYLPAVVA